MTRADLEALAKRCESEPASRELDADIEHERRRLPRTQGVVLDRLPHYSTSLDAATSLLPEGRAWFVGRTLETNMARAYYSIDGYISVGGKDVKPKTPALALCAAALRARAAMEAA